MIRIEQSPSRRLLIQPTGGLLRFLKNREGSQRLMPSTLAAAVLGA